MTPIGPHEPQLLPDDREDHVRRGLGQVVDLLHALSEADAEEATGAERNHRLHGLESGILWVAPRVDEAEETGASIRLEPDCEHEDGEPEPTGCCEHAQRRAGHDEHGGDHDHDRNGCPEVRLDDDESAYEADNESNGLGQLPERARGGLAGEACAEPEGEP